MIKSAKFETSCTNVEGTRALEPLPQLAFVGRSNVGKSSLLNMLVGQKGLAVTSSTPGRTRLINFFRVRLGQKILAGDKDTNVEVFFVDLPGYGFAAGSKKMQHGWGESIPKFLIGSDKLQRVFVLLDIRRVPSDLDVSMLLFLQKNSIPFTILATKADKFSRAQVSNHVRVLAGHLGVGLSDIIATSAKGQGRAEVLQIIASSIFSDLANPPVSS